jgi:hypothetical protein
MNKLEINYIKSEKNLRINIIIKNKVILKSEKNLRININIR